MLKPTYSIDVTSRKADGTQYTVSLRGGKNKLVDFLDGRNEVMEFTITRYQLVLDLEDGKMKPKKMASRAVSDDGKPMSHQTMARNLVDCIVGMEKAQHETTIS